ncbi:Aste57867_16888 [Aphanomyces stellatus]|uniref:Aste57867_16888 protein n=1 Tax=Aphanomyces stellatus TaxID=120398 RepID=A0A485L794_9STRA|nr:hypothetical protein As57867_016830 [Aphanomyces stellatus]VFT93651.1 Aste57867_16888 [Aphanomyces stellatus]
MSEYGELVVLGYSSYRRVGGNQIDKHQWLPVGAPNSQFRLLPKTHGNAMVPRTSRLAETTLAKAALTAALQRAWKGATPASQYVCVPTEASSMWVTEYVPSPDADMFQLGRQPSALNDFVVPGHLHGAKGTISRFAARIVCDRAPPYECRVYAGGFDTDRQLMLPSNAPKFCAVCVQWAKDASHSGCVGRVPAVADGNNHLTLFDTQTHDDDAKVAVDAVTRNGVRLWLPEHQQWFEVSVHGRLYAVAATDVLSERATIHRPTAGPVAPRAVLTHGAIVDLGGVHVKFLHALRPSHNASTMATHLDRLLNVHCPVQLHALHFDDPTTLPHVFPACGHVFGFDTRLAKLKQCPLCRTASTLVPLRLATANGQRLLSRDERTRQPEFVFNPCGHVAGAQLAVESVTVRLPSGKTICPFCATTLDRARPYSKLYFYSDDEDGDDNVTTTTAAG